jgi:hypothetical protein
MESALCVVGRYLENKDVVNLSLASKTLCIDLSTLVDTRYDEYVKSDKYKSHVILELNKMSFMIDQFKYNNQILTKLMFDYLMNIYEHWSWLVFDEMYHSRLKPPDSKHFVAFLKEKHLTMSDILPTVRFNYTHQHRPTKQFSYFKTMHIHSQKTS